MKPLMKRIGHRHFRSNITYFGDVILAADAPDLADNFPELSFFENPNVPDPRSSLAQIDQMAMAVERLRRSVVRQKLK